MKGGLAARLKRLGNQAAQAAFEETAPVESGLRAEEPVEVVEKAAAAQKEAVADPLDEATVMLFREEAEFEILLEMGGEAEAISVPAAAGQTVLEAVQAAGLSRGEPLDWECGDGGCGVCVMGLVGKANGLEPPDAEGQEMKTIQITEQVAPDPALYRLACLARVRGNVRLRRL